MDNQEYLDAFNSLLEDTGFEVSQYSNVLTSNRKIKTPIEALNCILGGGLPFGVVANSFGRPKTGKSTWLYQMMALFQKQYPEGICFIIDTETSGDPNRARFFGVDTSRVMIICPQSIESGFLAIMKMLENKNKSEKLKNAPVFGIWDSISNGLAQDNSTQSRMNAQDRARIIKNYMGPLMVEIEKCEFFLGLVNQAVYQDVGHGHKHIVSGGGIGLEHQVHFSLMFDRCNSDGYDGSFLVRRWSTASISKSKLSPEFSNIPILMDITQGGMIDEVDSFIEYLINLDIITKAGGWYRFTKILENYSTHYLYYIFKYYAKSFRYSELTNKVRDTRVLYNALRLVFMERISSIYKLQADIIQPYYQEVLAEFRQEYNPPELYMKEGCEERTSVINNLKADPELVKSIEESSKVDTNPVICLNCGKVHSEMYECDCGNSVLVTRETAMDVLEELSTLELTENQELEEDITDEEVQ